MGRPSEYQRQFTGNEPELVPNVIRGYRHWLVQSDGTIRSLSGGTWDEDWNRAACFNTRSASFLAGHTRLSEFHRAENVPDPKCTCGFYAYHQPTRLSRSSIGHLGVVEGRGRALVGPLGFRVAEARVAALAVRGPHVAQRVRARYPDVTVYESRAALLKAYPPARIPERPRHRLVIALLATALVSTSPVAALARSSWVDSGWLLGIMALAVYSGGRWGTLRMSPDWFGNTLAANAVFWFVVWWGITGHAEQAFTGAFRRDAWSLFAATATTWVWGCVVADAVRRAAVWAWKESLR